jgi:LemA protein
MAKKKKLSALAITGIVIAVLLVLVIFSTIGNYNSFVTLEETVDAKWANVQSAYQRRADLIPNLISTVQGAADFEKDTQTEIAAVRTSAVAAQQAVKNANGPSELSAASAQVDASIAGFSGLNINVEAYPQLRAVESFLSFQDELAGTENRVKVERDIYNEAVRAYNTKVRRFPGTIFAGLFGFDKQDSFAAESGAENAPVVAFS